MTLSLTMRDSNNVRRLNAAKLRQSAACSYKLLCISMPILICIRENIYILTVY